VLTFNLGLPALRPFGLFRVALAEHLGARLAAAPAHLRASGADVIALQEVYTSRQRDWLRQALHDSHPFACVPAHRRSLLGSGLMLLSRYPIRQGMFVPARSRSALGTALTERGFLATEIVLPGGRHLRLLNVHLTIGAPFRTPEARRLAEIEHLLVLAKQHAQLPAILLGDFNCSPEVEAIHYRRIIAAGYSDAFAAVAGAAEMPAAATWDATNPLVARGPYRGSPSQRIDHVFLPTALGGTIEPVAARIAFREASVALRGGRHSTLSDHYGLLVRLAVW
jgi:endonuclease/exonuclease/phosphatase family metal-dependent hydrolase